MHACTRKKRARARTRVHLHVHATCNHMLWVCTCAALPRTRASLPGYVAVISCRRRGWEGRQGVEREWIDRKSSVGNECVMKKEGRGILLSLLIRTIRKRKRNECHNTSSEGRDPRGERLSWRSRTADHAPPNMVPTNGWLCLWNRNSNLKCSTFPYVFLTQCHILRAGQHVPSVFLTQFHILRSGARSQCVFNAVPHSASRQHIPIFTGEQGRREGGGKRRGS